MYLMDANIFFEAMNRYYESSICPGFWVWMNKECQNRNIASVRPVYDEIREDKRFTTIIHNIADIFLDISDANTVDAYSNVVNYVNRNNVYTRENKDKFMNGADPWLIAKAMTTGYVLVTHEQLVPPDSKKVKIPNICKYFGVTYCNTFDVLRKLNAKFVLNN